MSPLFSQALDLVFYGMGTVFVFLSVLVLMTMVMSILLSNSESSNGRLVNQGIGADSEGQSVDPKLIAAISAAVKRHRHSKQ